jgi:hypothetical protein
VDERIGIRLLGVSFRAAPAAVREGLGFTPTQAAALREGAVARGPGLVRTLRPDPPILRSFERLLHDPVGRLRALPALPAGQVPLAP